MTKIIVSPRSKGPGPPTGPGFREKRNTAGRGRLIVAYARRIHFNRLPGRCRAGTGVTPNLSRKTRMPKQPKSTNYPTS